MTVSFFASHKTTVKKPSCASFAIPHNGCERYIAGMLIIYGILHLRAHGTTDTLPTQRTPHVAKVNLSPRNNTVCFSFIGYSEKSEAIRAERMLIASFSS